MRKMKNIFSWLGMEEEKTIIQDAEKHIEATINTVNCLSDAIKAYIRNDVAATSVAIQKVHEGEHAADVLKAQMLLKINSSFLAATDREDLIRFIKTLDKVADWTLSSARLLGFMQPGLPAPVHANMAAAMELIITAMSKLQNSVLALMRDDVEHAFAGVNDIDRLEHEADDRKREMIESILAAKLDPNQLIVVFHLADSMEGITDKINSAADYIKALAVKSKQ